MATETWTVSLSKLYKRHYTPKTVEQNAAEIFASVNTRSLKARGWLVETRFNTDGQFIDESEVEPALMAKGYRYITRINGQITFNADGKLVPPRSELEGVAQLLYDKASAEPVGAWKLDTLDGQPYMRPDTAEGSSDMTLVGYTDIAVPSDWDDYFTHLYGLQAHIDMVRAAIEAGIISDWSNRFHRLLVGPPGCGKSDLCRSVKLALGDDAVMEFDATATTAAGAIKDLNEREILPRVLIVEEIEKADPKALSFLLGILDLRGEIRKTTARGKIERETKLFVIATCNDLDLFNSLMAGALSSRFGSPVHFSRPNRDLLARILSREVIKVNGSLEWIQPTLDYCDEKEISDPRVVIGLALCGRDKWLTGHYRQMLDATSDPTMLN